MPGDKIVVALPFYTRLWITEGTSLTSEAYPMTGVDALLQKYNMTYDWDDAGGDAPGKSGLTGPKEPAVK